MRVRIVRSLIIIIIIIIIIDITCESVRSKVHERSSVKHKVLAANVDLDMALDDQDKVGGWTSAFVQRSLAVRVGDVDADDDVLL